MGLFDKKFCDICNGKIGLLGNRKLADGNLCKDCARLLSPFMTGRRQSSVEEIRQHLNYREENKKQVEAFTPTRILGNTTKVYLDENSQRFLVTRQRDWRDGNPDIVPLRKTPRAKKSATTRPGMSANTGSTSPSPSTPPILTRLPLS